MTSTYLDAVLSNPQYPVFCAISLLTLFALKYSFFDNARKYPVLNPKKPFEWSDRRVTQDFIANSRSLLTKARALYKDQPYWAYTEWGENLVIPPEFLDSLKGNRQLDFQFPARDAAAEGKPSPFDDSIEWFEKEYPKHDPATEQIAISLVAYHTTSDLLMETLFNLCQHPELLKPLREEIVTVLSEEGLKKTSLNNLKLMDSVLKESQRLRPILLGSFRRLALADITLPNGDVIKKGTRLVCDTTHMWGSEYYKDATTFDGYRYLKMRQTPGQDKHAHLVSTSSDHLAFGHGLHACPGRFFAANEIKIMLCHLLLKYDFKLEDGVVPTPTTFGFKLMGDGKAKLLVRRREAELDMESVEI
ncbi:cytochrome P450 [Fusarium acuminatum]|uniref:Cytochrome P450 n=1 Tax=Fusarium acuminatum TaxID=5515 RepID=A0ABZ2WTQ4_9HYPO